MRFQSKKQKIKVEAIQWRKHGDHPDVIDNLSNSFHGSCSRCGNCWPDHGLINVGGKYPISVCPEDWIVLKDGKDKPYVCRSGDFKRFFEKVEEGDECALHEGIN